MKKLIRTSVLLLATAVAGSGVTPLLAMSTAQDRDHDRDHPDESAYQKNRNYEQGWKDGLHHKHKDRKWKNDEDRRAYEAGYAHGDRGEAWQKPHDDHRSY